MVQSVKRTECYLGLPICSSTGIARQGSSPTCRELHRREASQYRYFQPRMVHSRGVVCAHRSCQDGTISIECIPALASCPLGTDAIIADAGLNDGLTSAYSLA